MYVCMYIYIYISLSLYIYIYIYTSDRGLAVELIHHRDVVRPPEGRSHHEGLAAPLAQRLRELLK